jgi:hypothetical protein
MRTRKSNLRPPRRFCPPPARTANLTVVIIGLKVLNEMKTNWKRKLMRKLFAVGALLCSSIMFGANSNEHTYNAPFDKVWTACVQAASENFVVTHSEKESGILSFKQGVSLMSNSYGTDVGVSVIKVSDTQTEVIVHPQKEKFQLASNLGHISKVYFKALDEKLK